jgi:hypothetical protein
METTAPTMEKRIENIKNNVDKMNKTQHIEILKILKNNNMKINENKSGVFINLSFLNEKTVEEIEEYIMYIQDQEKTLETLEMQKKEYENLLDVEH